MLLRGGSFLMKYLILASCLISFIVVHSFAQDILELTPMPEKCAAEEVSNAPEYKIGKVWPTGTKPVEKYLLISIQPDDFTKDKMIALARQLNRQFCKEKRFGVIVFDDYVAARYVTYLSITKDLEKAQRGFYHIDRKKRSEYIQFSSARGKPLDEIRIDLSNKR